MSIFALSLYTTFIFCLVLIKFAFTFGMFISNLVGAVNGANESITLRTIAKNIEYLCRTAFRVVSKRLEANYGSFGE